MLYAQAGSDESFETGSKSWTPYPDARADSYSPGGPTPVAYAENGQPSIFDAVHVADDEPVAVVLDDQGSKPITDSQYYPPTPGANFAQGFVPLVLAPAITTYIAPPPPPGPPDVPAVLPVEVPPMTADIDQMGLEVFGRSWYGTPEQIAQLMQPDPYKPVVTDKIRPVQAVWSLTPVEMHPTPNLVERSVLTQGLVSDSPQRIGDPFTVSPALLVGAGVAILVAIFLSR